MLQGKKILLGVCGSIAAYKATYLIRLLIKSGAEVQVVMTESATHFITPLTLSTLSKRKVITQWYSKNNGKWNNHIELALWADLIVIAPATANTISKFANGICDDLLTSIYLSAKSKVMVVPSMDLDMYKHKSTQNNINKLIDYENIIIYPDDGELASGLIGIGRMKEPENIVQQVSVHFNNQILKEKVFLITAGPTYEPLDPVRYIGNYSSGKMGYALAEHVAQLGAKVYLISGPSNEKVEHKSIKLINVETANQMLEVCLKYYNKVNTAIFAAAVSDYRPTNKKEHKFKKQEEMMTLNLTKNKDIAFELGKLKSTSQINIGFALETENEIENAEKKVIKKNLDFIVVNKPNKKNAGFGFDTNKIMIIDKNNNIKNFELKNKIEVAKDIIHEIININK